jgi:hypothetical protein
MSDSKVLVVISIDTHLPCIYLIPATETELIERLTEISKQEINYFDQSAYTEYERQTIDMLIGDDTFHKYEYDGHQLVKDISICKILNICMQMV